MSEPPGRSPATAIGLGPRAVLKLARLHLHILGHRLHRTRLHHLGLSGPGSPGACHLDFRSPGLGHLGLGGPGCPLPCQLYGRLGRLSLGDRLLRVGPRRCCAMLHGVLRLHHPLSGGAGAHLERLTWRQGRRLCLMLPAESKSTRKVSIRPRGERDMLQTPLTKHSPRTGTQLLWHCAPRPLQRR